MYASHTLYARSYFHAFPTAGRIRSALRLNASGLRPHTRAKESLVTKCSYPTCVSGRFNSTNAKPRPIYVFRSPSTLRPYRRNQLLSDRTVGLIPTMGALHAGHLSLARQAAIDNHEVLLSIYVNPTQFGVHEDFGSYPRTWNSDMALLEELNQELLASPEIYKGRVTAVFAPTTNAMYPTLPPSSALDGDGTFVTITPLGELLEGASRPVFFRGVATVCAKLFNIVQPERVYFGQKDIQQTAVIKRLVTDLHMDTEVRIVATEREPDGLAMSSRNVYLGERRRRAAVILPTALRIAETQYLAAEDNERARILGPALEFIAEAIIRHDSLPGKKGVKMELDYLSLADPESMEEIDTVDEMKGAILSAALKMLPIEEPQQGEDIGESGGASRVVRLIDNIILPSRSTLYKRSPADGMK